MRREYFDIDGFENVYLEDSFVRDIREELNEVVFEIDAVLRESHNLYEEPQFDEEYCYRKAEIIFTDVQCIEWKNRRMQKFSDVKSEIDYGNIDEFYLDDQAYHLSGDWGDVKIISKQPELHILD